MPEVVSVSKDPAKVRAGQLGASKRWSDPGNRKVVRLDSLTPHERALVLALVAARGTAKVADDAA